MGITIICIPLANADELPICSAPTCRRRPLKKDENRMRVSKPDNASERNPDLNTLYQSVREASARLGAPELDHTDALPVRAELGVTCQYLVGVGRSHAQPAITKCSSRREAPTTVIHRCQFALHRRCDFTGPHLRAYSFRTLMARWRFGVGPAADRPEHYGVTLPILQPLRERTAVMRRSRLSTNSIRNPQRQSPRSRGREPARR